MPNRLDWKIVLAGATMLISGVPALAHGGGSVGHSSSSRSSSSAVGRVGGPGRSVGLTSTRVSPVTRFNSHVSLTRFNSTSSAKMLVLTAPGMLTRITARPKTSTAADPPAADPPAASAVASTSGSGGKFVLVR